MICDVYKRVSCLRRGTVALTPFQIIQGEIISCSVTGSWNIDLIKQKVKWWKLQIQLKINSLQLFMQLLWCTQICRIMLYDLLKIYYRGQKAKFRLSGIFFFWPSSCTTLFSFKVSNILLSLSPPLQSLSDALISLQMVYPRRNLSADQWRNAQLLSLISAPSTMLNPAQSDTVSMTDCTEDGWNDWNCFYCLI